MQRTYAVTWVENGGPALSGKLELGPTGIELDGAACEKSVAVRISYGHVLAARAASPAQRLDRRPTLVLYRRREEPLRIASVLAPSIISEVAEQLEGLRSENGDESPLDEEEGIDFEPTPGPGDSDDGDFYSPLDEDPPGEPAKTTSTLRFS
jgi:hypothetical protein